MSPSLSLVLLLATMAAAAVPPRDVVRMDALNDGDAQPVISSPDGHELQVEHWKRQQQHQDLQQEQIHKSWWQFKRSFNRVYNDEKEEEERRQVFVDNLLYIKQHNELADKGLKTYRLGITRFADMTHMEFLAKMTGLKLSATQLRLRRGGSGIAYISPATKQSLPDTVDWRQKGAVTPVKDQGKCGSCWSFSTTGALEGQNFRKTGKLLSLSEQQLFDCSGSFGNQGCKGGYVESSFQYVKQYGIELETAYPYTTTEGTCRYTKSKVVANCTGYVDVPQGSEFTLKEAVANVGPVSVSIDASHPSFQHYTGEGVYNEPSCSSSQLNHAVLTVGYGTLDGSDYWLVKNSWGYNWGEQGYIRMARNKGNQCGIASAASYPTV